ncbi:hypothetical protein KSP40_PGU020801 [Platanthera guangdongensis]|uniref:Transketolase N-terminal domain-containing protein n=1 Tax=Platanthera guangdongensis TaxID=2320717 RepID=A0ABR2LNC6_9ASPA
MPPSLFLPWKPLPFSSSFNQPQAASQEEDRKAFRQWESRIPGHPENFETPGIKVTTGPLGQGIANTVGLALTEKHLAARFNKPDFEIVDHYTYVILGDGCQMEGVSNEASSLAGHWGLGKLIAFYDDNHISIDCDTEIAFTEDVNACFEALGWHAIWVKNGNTGYDDIRAAIKEAKAVKDKPTLIKMNIVAANSFSVQVHSSELVLLAQQESEEKYIVKQQYCEYRKP